MITRTVASSRRLRIVAALACLFALVALLSGCTSSGSDATAEARVEGEYFSESGAGGADGGADADGGEAVEEAPAEDPAVIVTGSMYMTVEDPIGTADSVTGIVQSAGGRIDGRTETAPDEYDGGSAWLRLRIPAAVLDAVIEDLRELGTVDEYGTESADVSAQVRDLEAEVSTLRASTDRIQALLVEAEDIGDIIALESELADRQSRLESLEARQRGLNDQVSFSTIELSLTTEPVEWVDNSPRTFISGLESGWDALTNFLSGALVVAGVLLPWLALLAVLGVALLAWRRARSRSRSKKASAEPTPAASAQDPSGH